MKANPELVIALMSLIVPTWFAWKAEQRQREEEKRYKYKKLQNFLAAKKWKAADQETLRIMRSVLRPEERGFLMRIMRSVVRPEEQGFLNSDDIKKFPGKHLRTINELWVDYSGGHFGFSVQKRIYESQGKDYDKFAEQVGWKKGDKWQGANEITFNLSAPLGHLPVVGQRLLGMGSLLSREDLEL